MDQQTETYEKHQLWTLLEAGHGASSSLHLLQQFAPAIGYFILSFRDINDFVLPYENPTDALRLAINNHAVEDSTHYRLFLEDWEKLGGDRLLDPYNHLIPVPNTQQDHRLAATETYHDGLSASLRVLSFLWSDAANKHNRKLLFQLTKLLNLTEDPIIRFAAIEAVEQTGLVMFRATSALVKEIVSDKKHAEIQKEYRYFGEYHLDLETGHLVNQDGDSSSDEETEETNDKPNKITCACESDVAFKILPLDEKQHEQCVKVVDDVYLMFSEWLDGIYTMMMNQ